jgi:hypothetical protein
MNKYDAHLGIHESHSFEVDEFNIICGAVCGGEMVTGTSLDTAQQVLFSDIFSDEKTRSIIYSLLTHVRQTSERISYPYRCHTPTHCVYLKAVVSKSSSMRVGFVNKLLGYEPRPGNARLECYTNKESPDFSLCSICNRLEHDGVWLEFQQLLEQKGWPATGRRMGCSFDTCENCENALGQRIAETQRSYLAKAA